MNWRYELICNWNALQLIEMLYMYLLPRFYVCGLFIEVCVFVVCSFFDLTCDWLACLCSSPAVFVGAFRVIYMQKKYSNLHVEIFFLRNLHVQMIACLFFVWPPDNMFFSQKTVVAYICKVPNKYEIPEKKLLVRICAQCWYGVWIYLRIRTSARPDRMSLRRRQRIAKRTSFAYAK